LDALSANLDQVESNGVPDEPMPVEETNPAPAPEKATEEDYQAAAAEIKPDEKVPDNVAQAAEQVTSETELDQL
jgi:hypothetical protein